ncbi:MAG: peptidylprolyl isomerase [Candidatus Zixiibacteriota bacterium]
MKPIMYIMIMLVVAMAITGCKGEKMYKEEDVLKANPIVEMETSKGTMKIELYSDHAPKHAWNFVKLTQEDFYDGLTFHRIIPNFMIQGGDPDGTGRGGPGYTIDAEISPELSHVKGSLAAARKGDQVNPEKKSSGSQFYICHVATPHLDGEYTIYGQVTEGMDVIDKIASVETGAMNKPVEDVLINDIKILELKPHEK